MGYKIRRTLLIYIDSNAVISVYFVDLLLAARRGHSRKGELACCPTWTTVHVQPQEDSFTGFKSQCLNDCVISPCKESQRVKLRSRDENCVLQDLRERVMEWWEIRVPSFRYTRYIGSRDWLHSIANITVGYLNFGKRVDLMSNVLTMKIKIMEPPWWSSC